MRGFQDLLAPSLLKIWTLVVDKVNATTNDLNIWHLRIGSALMNQMVAKFYTRTLTLNQMWYEQPLQITGQFVFNNVHADLSHWHVLNTLHLWHQMPDSEGKTKAMELLKPMLGPHKDSVDAYLAGDKEAVENMIQNVMGPIVCTMRNPVMSGIVAHTEADRHRTTSEPTQKRTIKKGGSARKD